MKRMTEYEEAIRTAVCTDCIYPSGIGMCGCGQWKECPLNRFLPQAIDAVTSGKSASLVDYFKDFLAEMRTRESELPESSRMPPEDREWFERFLPVITQAVEEVKASRVQAMKQRNFH